MNGVPSSSSGNVIDSVALGEIIPLIVIARTIEAAVKAIHPKVGLVVAICTCHRCCTLQLVLENTPIVETTHIHVVLLHTHIVDGCVQISDLGPAGIVVVVCCWASISIIVRTVKNLLQLTSVCNAVSDVNIMSPSPNQTDLVGIDNRGLVTLWNHCCISGCRRLFNGHVKVETCDIMCRYIGQVVRASSTNMRLGAGRPCYFDIHARTSKILIKV
eukprot:Lithocolla_globosa_v1_NODE_6553_length_1069_cov_7.557199.p2 type:complete len:216 gc:universal NODE_6553_length_1069_cov_7.557199:650-3(-)